MTATQTDLDAALDILAVARGVEDAARHHYTQAHRRAEELRQRALDLQYQIGGRL